MPSLRREQSPVGDGPHARRERLHLAATRDDEAEPPGVARDASHGEGAEHLGERAGVGAVRLMTGLDLDREDAVRGVQDEVDLAAGVSAEEVKRRGLRLSGEPAEQLVEDARLEQGTVGHARLLGEDAGQRGVGPVELGALDEARGDGWNRRAQEGDLVRDLEEAQMALTVLARPREDRDGGPSPEGGYETPRREGHRLNSCSGAARCRGEVA